MQRMLVIDRTDEGNDMSKKLKFFVKESEVTPYSPLNHTGTVNRRLIGPKETGSEHLEVLLGVVSKSHGALPHSHPGIDQVCYVIEGRAVAEIGGEREELGPGDACFFPADMPHTFTAVSEQPVKVLVIYTPPYGEKGAVTHASA
jgi:quercetin dioxygenase-like cupin family protein